LPVRQSGAGLGIPQASAALAFSPNLVTPLIAFSLLLPLALVGTIAVGWPGYGANLNQL